MNALCMDDPVRAKRDVGSSASLLSGKVQRLIVAKRDCEVFAVGDDLILKLFALHVPQYRVQREIDVSAMIHEAGVSAPLMYRDIVRNHQGRLGLVVARAPGETMGELLHSADIGTLRGLTIMHAQVHRAIHEHPGVPDLPPQRAWLMNEVLTSSKLSLGVRRRVAALLQSLPDEDRICHGDLHPGNIMIQRGRAEVIDWGGARRGSVICDVARTYLMLRHTESGEGTAKLVARFFDMFRSRLYLRTYFKGAMPDPALFHKWLVVNAAVRLKEEMPDSRRGVLLKLVRRHAG